MKQRITSFLSFLILTLTALHAQLRVEVSAPSSVDINEPYFQIRYTIATASADGIEGNPAKDFELLSGPNISVSQSTTSINGRVHSNQSTTYTYTLAPRTKGTFTIPAVTIRAAGHSYRSATATIRVTGQKDKNAHPQTGTATGGDPAADLRTAGSSVSQSDLFVKAQLKRHEVYEQEAVPLVYAFYERPGVGLNSVGLNQKPDFKGIVSQEIPVKSIDARMVSLGGHSYRSGAVQQYLLFPQQAGRIKIPALTFDCVVMQRLSDLDPFDAFFNGGGNIGQSLKRTTAEEVLVVKPLPTPKPADFSGGVGQFRIEGKLLTPNVRTNEMITYRVTVSGTGNLKLLSAPVITFPADFDTYAPKTNDQTQVTLDGVKGSVTFDYTFVPRNLGHYEVPEVRFVYFDPTAAAYKTIVLPAVPLDVKKGDRSEADLERERQLRNSDIRPINTGEAALKSAADYYHWNTAGYWSVYALLLAAFACFAYATRYYRRANADTATTRASRAAKTAYKQIAKAQKLLRRAGDAQDEKAFYAELSRLLSTYLDNRFGLATADMDKETLTAALTARGIDEPTLAALQQLQADCAYARFAPMPSDEDKSPAHYADETKRIIGEMERQLNQGKGKMKNLKTASASALLLTLLCLATSLSSYAAPVAAALDSSTAQQLNNSSDTLTAHNQKLTTKAAADSAYDAKNYRLAADLYEVLLKQGVSPAVYYNLANAYYRLGELPRAVLSYERSLKYDPANADARYNLAVVQSKLAVRSDTSSSMFFVVWTKNLIATHSVDFWADAAVVAFALCLLAFAGYRLLHRLLWRKLSFSASVLCLLVLAFCLTAAAVQNHRFTTEVRAVVMTDTTLAPDDKQAKPQPLVAGTTVIVLDESPDGNVLVATPSETMRGWVKKENLEKL